MPRKPKSDYATAFGQALDAQLAKRSLSQATLATSVGTSSSYVNQTMSGARNASPQWVNLVANSLALTEKERRELHTAAALDLGYELDLTKKTP